MPSRIEDYALVGDCETAALISRDGSVDWLCWPRFDSDACFAALLGEGANGFWRIAPCDPPRIERRYQKDTLVLETDFDTGRGAIRVTDFMPIREEASTLVRIVTGLRGKTRVRSDLVLRFDYGAVAPWFERDGDTVLARVGPDLVIFRSPVA